MKSSAFDFSGKVAVITGGASGIGLAIAHRFGAHGAAIEILDINPTTLDEICKELRGLGYDAQGMTCDVSDEFSVRGAFDTILARHSRMHILVNNAGVAHVGNALTTSSDDFMRIMKVNTLGVANCTKIALEHMTAERDGVILNMASTVVELAAGDRFAYSASKGAVSAMTYSVAKDFIEYGIRCNALVPARIHTPFVDGFIAKNYPDRQAEMFEKLSVDQPIGRMGKPDEVAVVALFLCSDEASFITGSTYTVDGGKIHLH